MNCTVRFNQATVIVNVIYCYIAYYTLKLYYDAYTDKNKVQELKNTISGAKDDFNTLNKSTVSIYDGIFELKNELQSKMNDVNDMIGNLLTNTNEVISSSVDKALPPKSNINIKTGLLKIEDVWIVNLDEILKEGTDPINDSINDVRSNISKGVKKSMKSINSNIYNIFMSFLNLITPPDIRPELMKVFKVDAITNSINDTLSDINEVSQKDDIGQASLVYVANSLKHITYFYLYCCLFYLMAPFVYLLFSTLNPFITFISKWIILMIETWAKDGFMPVIVIISSVIYFVIFIIHSLLV